MLETAVADASVVVLGDTVSVGGAANSLPAAVPPTATATATSAPASPAVSQTAEAAQPVSPPPDHVIATATPADLSGIGSVFDVVRVYVGDASSPLSVDAAVRAGVEAAVRRAELTPIPPPCGPTIGATRYTAGGRYLLLLRPDPRGGLVTVLRFRVEGDAVIVRDAALPFDGGELSMT